MLPNAEGAQVDDRTETQLKQFGLGLRASNIWYGHLSTVVLVQPDLPDGFETLCRAEGRPFTTYDASGWCFVEASLSSLIKGPAKRVDIGMFTTGKIPAAFGGPSCPEGQPLMSIPMLLSSMELCSRSRPPPMLPSKMAADLEHKSFFSRADAPQVAQLYETFFDAVAPSQTKLTLDGMSWGDAEVAVVAAALPRLKNVVELDLIGSRIGEEGARALAEALHRHSSLRTLYLSGDEIGAEGAKALANRVREHTSLEELHLFPPEMSWDVKEPLWEAVKGRQGSATYGDRRQWGPSLSFYWNPYISYQPNRKCDPPSYGHPFGPQDPPMTLSVAGQLAMQRLDHDQDHRDDACERTPANVAGTEAPVH